MTACLCHSIAWLLSPTAKAALCLQVRVQGDTHLYHCVYRKIREVLKDVNGFDLQLVARDETMRKDMCAMLAAREPPVAAAAQTEAF